jgi:hypothetical protein
MCAHTRQPAAPQTTRNNPRPASLGGVPFFMDKWGVDCMYSGSQKCLSAPPGGAPFAMSERAMEKLKGRKTKPATFNLDMNLIGDYVSRGRRLSWLVGCGWVGLGFLGVVRILNILSPPLPPFRLLPLQWGWFNSRSYHHTGMVSMCYAMREALELVSEEGLEHMWSRWGLSSTFSEAALPAPLIVCHAPNSSGSPSPPNCPNRPNHLKGTSRCTRCSGTASSSSVSPLL